MSVFGFSDLAFMGAVGGVASYDADAQAYITAVETADGQALETAVKDAINTFVVGCKADGIWDAIKASCIMAGARTLAGALVPLAGAAPTNYNFVAENYDRKTGLAGDGSTKYLDSNRNNNADPQNSKHVSVYASSLPASSSNYPRMISSGDSSSNDTFIARLNNNGNIIVNVNSSGIDALASPISPSFYGVSRAGSQLYQARFGQNTQTFTKQSGVPRNANIGIFAGADGVQKANARLAFYSIGESLDLALLDARVTALINAFAAAIP